MLLLFIKALTAGIQNNEPPPKPATRVPMAKPFLSGNHCIKAWIGGVYASPTPVPCEQEGVVAGVRGGGVQRGVERRSSWWQGGSQREAEPPPAAGWESARSGSVVRDPAPRPTHGKRAVSELE